MEVKKGLKMHPTPLVEYQHIAFIGVCLLVTLFCYLIRAFDLRAVGAGDADHEYASSFFDRPDLAVIVTVLGLAGLGLLIFAGWRLPSEMQMLLAGEWKFELFPKNEMFSVGARLSQVVGAVCFGLIGLRMMRLTVLLGLFVTVGWSVLAAYGYVIGQII